MNSKSFMNQFDDCRSVIGRIKDAMEDPKQDIRDSDEELYCAECILDAYAVHLLPVESQGFDCIGDYIKAIVEAALKKGKV